MLVDYRRLAAFSARSTVSVEAFKAHDARLGALTHHSPARRKGASFGMVEYLLCRRRRRHDVGATGIGAAREMRAMLLIYR